jgi:SAM-dependent methyltransferase
MGNEVSHRNAPLASTAEDWQSFWGQYEKGKNLARRKICFDRAIFILSQSCVFQKEKPTIYDLGCGFAEVSKHLLVEISGARLVAVDWSEDAIAVARCNLANFLDRCDLQVADCCTRDDFPEGHREKGDIILSLGVIEHFHDPENVLRRQIAILKKGGVLVLMVPNRFSVAPFNRRWHQLTGSWRFGYQREFTPRTLRGWCEKQGLVVLSEQVVQRVHSNQDDQALKVLLWFEHLIARLIPGWGFYSYVFAIKPASSPESVDGTVEENLS